MAAVNAPPGGRLRSVFAVGFVLGAALVTYLLLGVASLRPSPFVAYLVLLGGAMGGLVVASTGAAVGLTPIHGKLAGTLVVAGLGASIASVGSGYLLLMHPAGNHLPILALATVIGAGGWGAWQSRHKVLDALGIAAGLFLSGVITFGIFAATWFVGVICKLAGI
jgi:hypothetical protein